MVFSPDHKLVAALRANELWLYDSDSGDVAGGPIHTPGELYGLLFTPDGQRLIGGGPRGDIVMLSVPEGRRLCEPVDVGSGIKPADITRDGRRIAIGLIDGRVQIRDSTDCRLVSEYAHSEELNSVCFSPDGARIVSGSQDHTALVCDTTTGKQLALLAEHDDEVMSVDFHPSGRYVVTASRDFTARVWDINHADRSLLTLRHQGEVVHAEFSPDGQLLATASRDRTVGLWEIPSGRLVHPLLTHEQAVRNVRFSSDSKSLLALAFNGPRVWDVGSGNPLTPQLHYQIMGGTGVQSRSLMPAFSDDASLILVGTDAPQAMVWQLSRFSSTTIPDWFPELIEAIAGRQLRANDLTVHVSAREFLQLRERILNSESNDEYTLWARRWLEFSRPQSRSAREERLGR